MANIWHASSSIDVMIYLGANLPRVQSALSSYKALPYYALDDYVSYPMHPHKPSMTQAHVSIGLLDVPE